MLGDHTLTHQKAQEHLAQGRPELAEELYRQLIGQVNVIDFEYNEWLEGAARTYQTLGRRREAGYIYVYLERLDQARDLLPRDRHAADAGRVLELRARPLLKDRPAEAAVLLREAAALYGAAGCNVLAAIAYGDAKELSAAREMWERVLQDPRLAARSYEQGLVHFNLGLLLRRSGDRAHSSKHLVLSQQLLEELADDFEARGERERAFDCYAILIQLGKELQSYENLAEGYINCIRVLKEDNLKFYVLRYYEDFLRLSMEQAEFHAAAILCREAADYTRRVGLPYDRAYLRRAGDAWCQAAEQNEGRAGPVKMTENALLAALDAYNSIGEFGRVCDVYQRLGELAVSEKRQLRYRRLAQRYGQGVAATPSDTPAFPEHLRQHHAYPEIWFLDLVEWEYDGDPIAVCASIVGDAKHADMVRRRALHVLLLKLDADARLRSASQKGGAAAPVLRAGLLEQVAQGLGEMQTYASLRPLERLYADVDPRVRRAAVAALRYLSYKRTFQLIMRGLRDEDEAIRRAALQVIPELRFGHAVDPLIRIFREHEGPEGLPVKRAVLESLSRISDLSAGEFLIDVLRHEADPLRDMARRQLVAYDNPDIIPILKRYHEIETGRTRDLLEGLIRGK